MLFSTMHGTNTVNSVEDAFKFVDYQCAALGGESFEQDVFRKLQTRTLSRSTVFSGIGALEQGVSMIWAYLMQKLGSSADADDQRPPITSDSVVEWNEHSRTELMQHRPPPSHVYVDIQEFISEEIRRGVMNAAAKHHWTMTELVKTLLQPGAITRSATRKRCGRLCCIPTSSLHIAGTPCVDFSSMPGGSRLGAIGSAAVPYFTWLGLRVLLQENIIVHENVVGFPIELLSDYLGHIYVVFTLVMSLCKMGWPGRRERRITLLIHKRKVQVRLPWTPALVQRCERKCTICFRQWLLADTNELEQERAWAMRRSHSAPYEPRLGDAEGYMEKPEVVNNKMLQSLGVTEYTRLMSYRARWRHCAYVLNQDPDSGCGMKSDQTVFMTQIRNQGLIWVDSHMRWLTSRELLGLQGFPVFPQQKVHGDHCTFDHAMVRDRCAMSEQSGNTMPVPFMSLALLYALGCTSIGTIGHAPARCLQVRRSLRAILSTDSSIPDDEDERAVKRARGS